MYVSVSRPTEQRYRPVTTYLGQTKSQLQNAADEFLTQGKWNNVVLTDLFKGGLFADFTQIDALNPKLISSAERESMYPKIMSAMVINTAWIEQRVWIMSYPMTKYEFMNYVSKAGDNDSRLKHWYKGRGYYLQS